MVHTCSIQNKRVPVMGWRPVQGATPASRPTSAGIGSSQCVTLKGQSGLVDGWKTLWKKALRQRFCFSDINQFSLYNIPALFSSSSASDAAAPVDVIYVFTWPWKTLNWALHKDSGQNKELQWRAHAHWQSLLRHGRLSSFPDVFTYCIPIWLWDLIGLAL